MSTTKRDYYDVLEVSRTATPEEIKKSFRRKAKELHPDTNDSPDAEALFKELGEAYDVLSDASKRQVYDTYGHDGLRNGGYSPNYDFMDGFPDLGDLFSSFFGGFSQSGRRRGGPQRGDDLRTELVLDFEEAIFGVKREIPVRRLEHCEPCQGSGATPGSGPTVCTTCGGSGQLRQTTQTIIGHFTQIVGCPRCQGQGTMVLDPCKTCQGRGRVQGEKKLSLTIPAGVDEGTRLRVANEGDAGPLGGPPGDLYVVIAITPHPHFQRDGYNIHAQEPVTYAQLVLGGEIEVPVLQGTQKIKIPAGTPSGHTFVLKNAGVPLLNQPTRRGDHFVQVQISIPTRVSGEEKKLLEKLQELHEEKSGEKAGREKEHGSLMDKFKDVISGNL